MEQLQHLLGLCPDSQTHISILKALAVGLQDLYNIYLYLKHLVK